MIGIRIYFEPKDNENIINTYQNLWFNAEATSENSLSIPQKVKHKNYHMTQQFNS